MILIIVNLILVTWKSLFLEIFDPCNLEEPNLKKSDGARRNWKSLKGSPFILKILLYFAESVMFFVLRGEYFLISFSKPRFFFFGVCLRNLDQGISKLSLFIFQQHHYHHFYLNKQIHYKFHHQKYHKSLIFIFGFKSCNVIESLFNSGNTPMKHQAKRKGGTKMNFSDTTEGDRKELVLEGYSSKMMYLPLKVYYNRPVISLFCNKTLLR